MKWNWVFRVLDLIGLDQLILGHYDLEILCHVIYLQLMHLHSLLFFCETNQHFLCTSSSSDPVLDIQYNCQKKMDIRWWRQLSGPYLSDKKRRGNRNSRDERLGLYIKKDRIADKISKVSSNCWMAEICPAPRCSDAWYTQYRFNKDRTHRRNSTHIPQLRTSLW